eukprot:TRINITY_DN1477_c0_g2_i1.p1 TRINITY_DN1477_c0_g2~~TRINITY_DN1477_c0_g2_i1.p1  ORF type:complete len:386 (+),score=53.86 TRINITY_DN1477_c0_g2_i1:201-1358(+)
MSDRNFQEHIQKEDKITWAFSSSGWLYIYFLGVVKCLKTLKLQKNIYAVGSSGGAAASSTIFLDVNEKKLLNYVFDCVEEARSSFRNVFRIRKYMVGACAGFLHEGASGRLQGNVEISVTKLGWLQNLRIKEFRNNDHVQEAILSSCCLVPLAGLPIWMDGVGFVMDGAFSDVNLFKAWLLGKCLFELSEGKESISVCPFYCSRANIKPSKYIPPWWAIYPPQPQQMQQLFDLGFHDALNYLTNPQNPMFQIVNQLNDQNAIRDLKLKSQLQIMKQASFKSSQWAPKFPFNLLIEFCWMCILLELFFMLFISGSLAIFAAAMPRVLDRREQYVRFVGYLQSLVSIQLLVKAVPALGSFVQFQKETLFGQQLHQQSIIFRFLYFVL